MYLVNACTLNSNSDILTSVAMNHGNIVESRIFFSCLLSNSIIIKD